MTIGRDAKKFSMYPKIKDPRDPLTLNIKKATPGPGTYKHIQMDKEG
jgi:hypothetical protein